MANYQLTNKAVEDLDSIWLYTCEVWSEKQADQYYHNLIAACESICKDSFNADKEYDEIQPGLKCRHCYKHLIFYKYSSEDLVTIIRILHERMDIESKF